MESPDTVSEALRFLAGRGYRDEFELSAGGLRSAGIEDPLPVHEVVVDYAFRFEGPSDPGDEAIVLGVSCPAWGSKGVVASAYGPGADPEHARLLAALGNRAKSQSPSATYSSTP